MGMHMCMFVCVCVYMHVHVCMHTHVCVVYVCMYTYRHVHVEAGSWHHMSSSIAFLLFPRQALSLNQELMG